MKSPGPMAKCIDIPPRGWLEHLSEIATRYGIVLISDEVVLGYRYSLTGYMHHLNPDLRCYGKAMAQGTALSAVCGPYDIMEMLSNAVHFSGTNNGEPGPLRVARQVLHRYRREGVCGTLREKGQHLQGLLTAKGFSTTGLPQRFQVNFDSDEAKESAVNYCWDNGILFPGFVSLQTVHTAKQMLDLVETLDTWREQYVGHNHKTTATQ